MALRFPPQAVNAIALACLGNPNAKHSNKRELRYGTNGSLCVHVEKATFYDNEAAEGGGMIDLVARAKGLTGQAAIRFMCELGAEADDEGQQRRPEPAPARAPAQEGGDKFKIVRTYDYHDEAGELVFQVCRLDPKSFRQRRPDPSARDEWTWKVQGTRPVPYRLPDLLAGINAGAVVFIAEGEKDCDNLRGVGLTATCNAGGAGKWPAELAEHFAGADVVILPDRDPQARKPTGELRWHPSGAPVYPGQDHAVLVAQALAPVAARVRVLELPGLPLKGDVSDWFAAGGNVADLLDMVDAMAIPGADYRPPEPEGVPAGDVPWEGEQADSAPTAPAPWRSRFGAITLSDLDEPGPEYEPLIKRVLTRGEVSMLVGPSGSGKSFLATDMGLTIARGIDWIAPVGRPAPRVRKGGVLYIAGEGARGVKKRLRAYLKHHALAGADLPFVLLTVPVDLHGSDEPTQWLIEEAQHHDDLFRVRHGVPLELVVIDTLSASTPGANENASDDISRVLGRCQRLARDCTAAVMLVHHMRADGLRERGHSSLRANVDSVVEVVKTEQRDASTDQTKYGRIIRTAKVTKQKDDEDGLTFRFVLHVVGLGTDADGDPVTSCVVGAPDMGEFDDAAATTPDRGPKLSDQAMVFLRALDGALAEHGTTPPSGSKLPASLRVVGWSQFRDAFATITGEGQDEPDGEKRKAAIRQAMKRHGDAMVRRGIVGRDNNVGIVWRTGKRAAGEREQSTGGNVVPFERPAREPEDAVDLSEWRIDT